MSMHQSHSETIVLCSETHQEHISLAFPSHQQKFVVGPSWDMSKLQIASNRKKKTVAQKESPSGSTVSVISAWLRGKRQTNPETRSAANKPINLCVHVFAWLQVNPPPALSQCSRCGVALLHRADRCLHTDRNRSCSSPDAHIDFVLQRNLTCAASSLLLQSRLLA